MAADRNPRDASLELKLPPRAEASGLARKAIRERLSEVLPAVVLVDLLIVVSELVTNAVQHGPGRSISLTLSLDADRDLIRGEVVDDGDASKSIPRIRQATTRSGAGHGLSLVDAMTSEWTVVEGSTSVRFVMPASDR